MSRTRALRMVMPTLAVGLGLATGCGITPKSFRALSNPAAIVRARAVGLGEHLPAERVVPALIDRLGDSDPVVRLTANHELCQMTGQDFGFVPWADGSERLAAIGRWKAWWNNRQAGVARVSKKP